MAVCSFLLALALAAPAAAQAIDTFTVKSAGDDIDGDPGDGDCDFNDDTNEDDCTLRAAIQEANALPNVSGNDRIEFDGAVTSIAPATALPAITSPVDLGTSAGSCPGSAAVDIDGTDGTLSGLTVNAGAPGSTICGVAVFNFATQISLFADDTTIEGTYVGLDRTGAAGGAPTSAAGSRCRATTTRSASPAAAPAT